MIRYHKEMKTSTTPTIPSAPATHSLTILKYFNFFMYGTWSLLNPFLPLYFEGIGFSNVQIGLLMSVGPLVSLIANPFWGYWSDRTQNTRLIIIVMLIGNLILSQIYFQMNDFLIVFSVMLCFYFFQTALNPLSNSLILHAIAHTDQRFGTFRLWGSIGFAFMVLTASPLIEYVGVGQLGYIYGSFMVLTIILSFRLPAQGAQRKKTSVSMRNMASIMTNKVFIVFLIFSVLLSIPNRMNSTFISVYISQLGGSEVYVGWSWFFAAIAEVPVFMLLDRYLKKTPKMMFGLMAVVGILYALRWVLMTAADAPYQIMMIQLLHSVTFGISFYLGTQICDYLVPDTYRTTGQAIYALNWMGVSGLIAGPLGGWMFDAMGPDVMYITSVAMSLIGAAGFLLLWRRFRLHRHQEAIQA